VKTFDIKDLRDQVQYIHPKNFDKEGQELQFRVSSI
jgi:hypothetical protein